MYYSWLIFLVICYLFGLKNIHLSMAFAQGSTESHDHSRWKNALNSSIIASVAIVAIIFLFSVFAGTTGRRSAITDAQFYLVFKAGAIWLVLAMFSPIATAYVLNKKINLDRGASFLKQNAKTLLWISPIPAGLMGGILFQLFF